MTAEENNSSEIVHTKSCAINVSAGKDCYCGAYLKSQGICLWCWETGDERYEKVPATYYYDTFALCDFDNEIYLEGENL